MIDTTTNNSTSVTPQGLVRRFARKFDGRFPRSEILVSIRITIPQSLNGIDPPKIYLSVDKCNVFSDAPTSR
jgi:hypothetical protein